MQNDLIVTTFTYLMNGGSEEPVTVEKKDGIAILRLNRPGVRNALSFGLVSRLAEVLHELDGDESVGATVLTGGDSFFSGGADVKEMAGRTASSFSRDDDFSVWDALGSVAKPVIAAVEGYALGGGCELAMACDMVVAAEDARFGQPEIELGIMPGAGGTQRLTMASGKYKAMRYVLTGEPFQAAEAERIGIVSAVVPKGHALAEACRYASVISSRPRVAVLLAKKAVKRAAEGGLAEGILYERSLFYSLFATLDQKEGMDAFLKKRKPQFRGE